MNSFMDGIKITLFELMAYVLPGYVSLALMEYFFNLKYVNYAQDPLIFFVVVFLLGHVIHTLSVVVTIEVKDLGWLIYHRLKEKDENGKGVETPKGIKGKIAKVFREKYLDTISKQKNNLVSSANAILQKKDENLKTLNGLEFYHVKEVIFADNPRVSEYFLFTHYYSVLCRSLALLSVGAVFLFTFNLYIANSLNMHDLILLLVSGSVFEVFLNRHNFYKQYRSKLIDAHVIAEQIKHKGGEGK